MDAATCPPERILADLPPSARRAAVGRIMGVLRTSFPIVAKLTSTPAAAAAWLEDWERHFAAARLTGLEIERGLARLKDWPADRPFNWPDFARLCRPGADVDARRELDAARSAFARREFTDLAPATWQAAVSLGFARIFNGDGVTETGWAQALDEARARPDPAILARQPGVGQARISQTADARREARERQRQSCEAAMAGLPKHLRPARYGSPESP